jgi:hypothetical protein
MSHNRFEAVQGAIKAAHEDYQKTEVPEYTPGQYAIVNALLVIASEIANLADQMTEAEEGKP